MSVWERRPAEPASEWTARGVANAWPGWGESNGVPRSGCAAGAAPRSGGYSGQDFRTRPRFGAGVARRNRAQASKKCQELSSLLPIIALPGPTLFPVALNLKLVKQ